MGTADCNKHDFFQNSNYAALIFPPRTGRILRPCAPAMTTALRSLVINIATNQPEMIKLAAHLHVKRDRIFLRYFVAYSLFRIVLKSIFFSIQLMYGILSLSVVVLVCDAPILQCVCRLENYYPPPKKKKIQTTKRETEMTND